MLLQDGCRYKIGDGNYVNVWKDSWLRDMGNLKVETTLNVELYSLKVAYLFIPDTKKWNMELIMNLF